jgi:hypothetical protein
MDIWKILRTFGILYDHLGYCMTIWNILCSFGKCIPVLVSRTKKNLATLIPGVDVMITIFCDFLTIFGEKIVFFFSKTNVMIKILHNLVLFWVKNPNFFAEKFGENIFKIITSVPRQRFFKKCHCSLDSQQTEDEKDLEYAFFGIYDGHGGREASQYAKVNKLAIRQLIYRRLVYFHPRAASSFHILMS